MKRPPFLLLILLIPVLAFVAELAIGNVGHFHYGMYFPNLLLKASVFFCFFFYALYWVLIRKWQHKTIVLSVGFLLAVVAWFYVVRSPLIELGGAFLALALTRSVLQKDTWAGFLRSLLAAGLGAVGLVFLVFLSPWMAMTAFLTVQILYEMFWEGLAKSDKLAKDRFWRAYRVAREVGRF